jgi:DNA mismatch endonuclease (patch repair protein)
VADHREEVEASVQHARRHIQRVSKPHRALKEALTARGQTFQTEYPLGPYSIDEADPSVKVAVEVDGCYWHGCEACGFDPQPGMASLDKRKNIFLVRRGWRVVRISECSIKTDIEACAERVVTEVEDARRNNNP